MSINNAPTIGIGKLLSEGHKYLVPHHQRDYSWTEDQIEQLFIDIEDAMTEFNDEYFLGLMVFIPDRNKNTYQILDGQQRIVTTSIIFSSIRNWLNSYGYTQDSEKIQSDFIGIREYGESGLEPRLELNINNNDFFYNYVVEEKPIEDIEAELRKHNKYSPNFMLLNSIIFSRKKIADITGRYSNIIDASNYLYNIVKFIRDNVKVVRLVVPDESNAYTVFETLNARGLELSALDLVKNYVFGKALSNRQKDLEILQTNWTEVMSNLITTDSEDFLKVYWTSRNGRIQVSKLFNSIKKKIRTYEEVKAFTNELVVVSDQYENLYISDSHVWSNYSKKCKNKIQVLNVVGSKQLSPVILSALSKFDPKEIEKLIDFLEKFIVRYQLIVGGRTGLIEIACARLSKKIFEEEIKKASKAALELKEIFPSDDVFYDAFLVKQEKNTKKANLILSKLEEQYNLQIKNSVDILPHFNLTVEHILPKNPNQDWMSLFHSEKKNIEDYKYRLGNMCLLSDVNKGLGSKGFNFKKEEYCKSEINLTKKVAEYKQWDFEAIETRQKFMADIALTTWAYKYQ